MRHENGSWHEGILKDINHMQERSIDMREAHFHIKRDVPRILVACHRSVSMSERTWPN